jgi:hypothetical protein
MKTKLYSIILAIIAGAIGVPAQTGGAYDLSHNTLAGGGEMQSAGGAFKVDGTVGQTLAGTTSGSAVYSLHGGFWFPRALLAPTAARVSLTGRVSNLQGGLLRRVRIVLSDTNGGETRTAQVNPFGYFRFDDVEAGRVYIVRAESGAFQFTPEMYVFSLVDARDDLDFTAIEAR